MREAARARPVGQLGVHAFAVDDQRRQQADVLTAVVFEQLRSNALGALRHHGRAVLRAMLDAQLHIQQAQKVPDLGGGAHRGLAPAAREPLLNRHGGRNAVDRIHLGPAGRLHDGAGISVERLQVAALALVEQNIKGQRGLARARDTGDHIELTAWNINRQTLQVVFTRIDDLDQVGSDRPNLPGLRPDVLDRMHLAHGGFVLAQRQRGVRAGVLAHSFRRAFGDHPAAVLTAFGAQINQPVG